MKAFDPLLSRGGDAPVSSANTSERRRLCAADVPSASSANSIRARSCGGGGVGVGELPSIS